MKPNHDEVPTAATAPATSSTDDTERALAALGDELVETAAARTSLFTHSRDLPDIAEVERRLQDKAEALLRWISLILGAASL